MVQVPYEMKVKIMMVNNATNISHLHSLNTQTTTAYGSANPGSVMGQTQNVTLLKMERQFLLLITGSPTAIHT